MKLTHLLGFTIAAAAGFICMAGYAPRRGESSPSEDGRCIAITQRGERCRRPARPGSRYCAQHDPHR